MYLICSVLIIGIGVLLLTSTRKISQKNCIAAGLSGILGACLIVMGLGAIYFVFIGQVQLPLFTK